MHTQVYVWGSGDNGQLGLGNTTEVYAPTINPFFSGYFPYPNFHILFLFLC